MSNPKKAIGEKKKRNKGNFKEPLERYREKKQGKSLRIQQKISRKTEKNYENTTESIEKNNYTTSFNQNMKALGPRQLTVVLVDYLKCRPTPDCGMERLQHYFQTFCASLDGNETLKT